MEVLIEPGKETVGDWLLWRFAEIAFGRCSIKDENIAKETDSELRNLMIGLKSLHEDLERERIKRDEAVSARDEFISIAAHELRTPLTSIRLQMDLMNQSKSLFPSEDARRFDERTQVLKRQLLRLENLVEELLDVSRITSETMELRPGNMDIRELAWEVQKRLLPETTRLNVDLTVQAPRPVLGVWDRDKLDQIFTNLLSNALRFGNGKPIEIELVSQNDRVSLSVTDHGIGLAEEDKQRIFQPFVRAVSSRHHGGLGMGLWIVRQIVEAMSGTVRVESEPGVGSTFTVNIPTNPPHYKSLGRRRNL